MCHGLGIEGELDSYYIFLHVQREAENLREVLKKGNFGDISNLASDILIF